jgi:c-di-GMP-binding flagellar brake protein YcgR
VVYVAEMASEAGPVLAVGVEFQNVSGRLEEHLTTLVFNVQRAERQCH